MISQLEIQKNRTITQDHQILNRSFIKIKSMHINIRYGQWRLDKSIIIPTGWFDDKCFPPNLCSSKKQIWTVTCVLETSVGQPKYEFFVKCCKTCIKSDEGWHNLNLVLMKVWPFSDFDLNLLLVLTFGGYTCIKYMIYSFKFWAISLLIIWDQTGSTFTFDIFLLEDEGR